MNSQSEHKREDLEFVGYDLGHGETALARAYARSLREPEILEHRGQRSFVTAVAKSGRQTRIGAEAVNLSYLDGKSKVWLKFKGRDLTDSEVREPTQLFTKTLITSLSKEKKIRGGAQSRFIIGCPSGWPLQDRDAYQAVFEGAGLKHNRIVPESRAALMTALEQGYLTIDAARSSVLIVDIGSSTTDFTYCRDLEAEDVGHNILGSGLLDSEILRINLERQPHRKKIESLIKKYPHYKTIMEFWCREAKEQYFNGTGVPVDIIKRLPIDGGVLFEIRIDSDDSKAILTEPLDALNGYSWQSAFDYALSETIDMLGGRAPETVLLTGGASRLPIVGPACEKTFPKARIIRGAEPEFAIARGLAWLGRFEYLHSNFKSAVADLLSSEGVIATKAREASTHLGERMAPVLVDALAEACIVPAFKDWRAGRVEKLEDVETALEDRVRAWLSGDEAQATLRPIIDDWFADLQRDIEKDTDPLCREHGLPAMVLSLGDSQHVSQYLEDMRVQAPKVASLETDTALAGTTLTTLIVGALLAKANLLAPLLANPVGLVIGGALAGGGFLFVKKALSGQFRKANVPRYLRIMMTDGRIKRAVKRQRKDMVTAVKTAWDEAAARNFSDELVDTLQRALTERADERAVLFLL